MMRTPVGEVTPPATKICNQQLCFMTSLACLFLWPNASLPPPDRAYTRTTTPDELSVYCTGYSVFPMKPFEPSPPTAGNWKSARDPSASLIEMHSLRLAFWLCLEFAV